MTHGAEIGPGEIGPEIARLTAAAADALAEAEKLGWRRDVRYAAFWDGYRRAFGGTTDWSGINEGGPADTQTGITRYRIRAGVDALDAFDRATGDGS